MVSDVRAFEPLCLVLDRWGFFFRDNGPRRRVVLSLATLAALVRVIFKTHIVIDTSDFFVQLNDSGRRRCWVQAALPLTLAAQAASVLAWQSSHDLGSRLAALIDLLALLRLVSNRVRRGVLAQVIARRGCCFLAPSLLMHAASVIHPVERSNAFEVAKFQRHHPTVEDLLRLAGLLRAAEHELVVAGAAAVCFANGFLQPRAVITPRHCFVEDSDRFRSWRSFGEVFRHRGQLLAINRLQLLAIL